MKVFLSHSSKDKPEVESLALALCERGIEPWLDKWEIGSGENIVAAINKGLEESPAGIIVFSKHSKESPWVEAEINYLTYARTQEGKVLIPVMVGDDAWVPPLLRPLARRGIEEIDAIADALKGRKGGPPPVRAPERGQVQQVLIALHRDTSGEGVQVEVRINGKLHESASHATLPQALFRPQKEFLSGFSSVPHRNPVAAERTALESSVADMGRRLRSLCLPGDAGETVAVLLDCCPVGTLVEVCVEAEGAELLGLPFEALRLPDDRVLSTHPSAVMMRRPKGLNVSDFTPLAGPSRSLLPWVLPTRERPRRRFSTRSGSCRTSSMQSNLPGSTETPRSVFLRWGIPT